MPLIVCRYIGTSQVLQLSQLLVGCSDDRGAYVWMDWSPPGVQLIRSILSGNSVDNNKI